MKPEIYRVALRYGLSVFVVANSGMETPNDPRVESVRVGSGADAADDWIVAHLEATDIVVTTDVPLAARCVAKRAAVLHPTGRRWTEDDIGSALAMRDLLTRLRSEGERTRGPAPFQDRDRSSFLQALDATIQKGLRARPRDPASPSGPAPSEPRRSSAGKARAARRPGPAAVPRAAQRARAGRSRPFVPASVARLTEANVQRTISSTSSKRRRRRHAAE